MNIKIDQIRLAPDRRPRKEVPWLGILIHHTGLGQRIPETKSAWDQFNESVIKWLTTKDNYYISAHYQIGRNGHLTQMVDPEIDVAYHAGKSSWWSPLERRFLNDLNDRFIGIELLGDGNRIEFTDNQYEILTILCRDLMGRFPSISAPCITGHEFVAEGRKIDPGHLFNWKRFFRNIFT